MKKYYCLVIFIILFSACQKGIEPFDDPGSTPTGNDITGTWSLVSLTGSTQAIAAYSESGTDYKTITSSNYVTSNNTGAITFSNSQLTSNNLGYSISSILYGYDYQNNVLTDSTQMPFMYAVDSSNSNSKYELIGSDSIYFPEGGFVSFDGSLSAQTAPAGGKISVTGNTLTLTQMVNSDTTEVIIGAPYHLIQTGMFVSLFQKQ